MASEDNIPSETDVRPVSAEMPLAEAETERFGLLRSQSMAPSDVLLAGGETGAAPSLPAPSPPPVAPVQPTSRAKPLALLPGAKVDDFEVVRLLGRGAFGHVYLARQMSLDRHVALKISANRGSEGRTMARLEHQNIVQVFSEKVEPEFNQRLLCMQLVPGVGMEKLIGLLHPVPAAGVESKPREWNGADLLAILDRSASLPIAFDPAALHDREALARMDSVEATAWFGARLAEALDFAHQNGVLHRDIKPANILVNTYGRPLLADFNISSQPVGSEPSGEEMFGGTFAYMAPEHMDAFNPADATTQDAVTAQSDLYSLGLVLQQLLDGRMVFPLQDRRPDLPAMLREMAAGRRSHSSAVAPGPPSARKTLERTIARCLEPNPADRFASGAELAEQLDGCRQLRTAERELPPPPKLLRPVIRRPILWLLALTILPQLAGSAVNITYNLTQIVRKLEPAQESLFAHLVVGYNLFVYPLAIVIFLLALRPVWQCWDALREGKPARADDVNGARRRTLQLPGLIAALTAGGWFPGGILFPVIIHILRPPLDYRIMAHFFVSFYLSGLIALAYSLCGAQFVALRGLYPGLWVDVRSFADKARHELRPITARLKYILLLAGSIPLLAAVLTLGLGGETPDRKFRLLVVSLIVLGGVGYHLASAVTRGLYQVVVALTGSKS